MTFGIITLTQDTTKSGMLVFSRNLSFAHKWNTRATNNPDIIPAAIPIGPTFPRKPEKLSAASPVGMETINIMQIATSPALIV